MKPRIVLAAAALLAALPAHAVTLTFDDLPTEASFQSYEGFSFTNLFALDARTFIPSGYANGVVTRENVAFNGNGNVATITGAAPFSLASAYLTAAWNDGLTFTVIGQLRAAAVFTQSFVLDTAGPLLASFNHAVIDRAVIVTTGGTHHDGYDGGYGTQVAIDNLVIDHAGGTAHSDTTVPEPATWALMLGGFTLAGSALRRRRWVAA